jgi:hypothetical protein
MSDESRRILEMLAQGKVTVEQADQLLHAVGETKQDAPGPSAPREEPKPGEQPRPRFLRITVHKDATADKREKNVTIRIPLSLVRGGMRLPTMIPGISEKISERLREKGIHVDFTKLDPDKLDELLKELGELTVDVDKGADKRKEQVRITCE